MKVTLLFFFLFVNLLHGQEIEEIRKLDTVYILFKADKNQTKYFENECITCQGYYFLEGFFLQKDTLGIFTYDKDSNRIYRPANDRYEKKSFLKKHKKEIIHINFFKKLKKNMEEFGESYKPQIYYIIDMADFRKNKIKLTEVNSLVYVME
ncbi:hypothetical protein [Flavobacterium caseinilyticum]|uniref:Uncharacterized protein n=1 Tax=Flavobacterium caseinilyticum TaxID=2541732 RepID=A0A4R5B4D7_9FLAO|nr:hypothetical protein [Flavobacterium caseinilyticum]TDD78444.1 hypothetical protein E0F89_02075 [Flavobacterium caseinilyticum]